MTVWLMLAGLAIALLVGMYVFGPYFERSEKEEDPRSGRTYFELERRRGTTFVDRDPKEALMEELAQLEYDFRSGKLRPEDYEELGANLEERLLRLQSQSKTEGQGQEGRGDAGAD
jgi:hypothetical protein